MIQSELRYYRRQSVKRAIKRYLRILKHIGNPNSWDFLEELSVIGYLKQNIPINAAKDDDIIFYIDFQSALWSMEANLRVTFALRYIWRMVDDEIAVFHKCTRRTILRWMDRIVDCLYEEMRDYFARGERELLDILECRF